jgi:rod shape-determining protein MreC
MPLGTVDRTPPPLFRQGASALSRLLVVSALAIVLMVLDSRQQMTAPLRLVASTAIAPLQWLALQPLLFVRYIGNHMGSLQDALDEAETARNELTRHAQRSAIVEHLSQENLELRGLLNMQTRAERPSQVASIVYEVADPYSRKVMLNRGLQDQVEIGSAVIDGFGVVGQITRVYLTTSEVTLLTDRQQAIGVLNTRTGQRSLAFGLPDLTRQALELRFESMSTDAAVGDILTTSGIDGVYPPGLPVGRISLVQTVGTSGFARIEAEPMGRVNHAMHVLIVSPGSQPLEPALEPDQANDPAQPLVTREEAN